MTEIQMRYMKDTDGYLAFGNPLFLKLCRKENSGSPVDSVHCVVVLLCVAVTTVGC